MQTVLDLRGMKCPLPLLRTQKMLKSMNVGDNLMVRVTDRNAIDDFEALERFGVVEILRRVDEVEELNFYIRRNR